MNRNGITQRAAHERRGRLSWVVIPPEKTPRLSGTIRPGEVKATPA